MDVPKLTTKTGSVSLEHILSNTLKQLKYIKTNVLPVSRINLNVFLGETVKKLKQIKLDNFSGKVKIHDLVKYTDLDQIQIKQPDMSVSTTALVNDADNTLQHLEMKPPSSTIDLEIPLRDVTNTMGQIPNPKSDVDVSELNDDATKTIDEIQILNPKSEVDVSELNDDATKAIDEIQNPKTDVDVSELDANVTKTIDEIQIPNPKSEVNVSEIYADVSNAIESIQIQNPKSDVDVSPVLKESFTEIQHVKPIHNKVDVSILLGESINILKKIRVAGLRGSVLVEETNNKTMDTLNSLQYNTIEPKVSTYGLENSALAPLNTLQLHSPASIHVSELVNSASSLLDTVISNIPKVDVVAPIQPNTIDYNDLLNSAKSTLETILPKPNALNLSKLISSASDSLSKLIYTNLLRPNTVYVLHGRIQILDIKNDPEPNAPAWLVRMYQIAKGMGLPYYLYSLMNTVDVSTKEQMNAMITPSSLRLTTTRTLVNMTEPKTYETVIQTLQKQIVAKKDDIIKNNAFYVTVFIHTQTDIKTHYLENIVLSPDPLVAPVITPVVPPVVSATRSVSPSTVIAVDELVKSSQNILQNALSKSPINTSLK